jgi:propanol-preferring alcohol dehydrogenase
VVATVAAGKGMAETVKGLRPRGELARARATPDPIEVSAGDLFAAAGIEGALTGDPATGDATLPVQRADRGWGDDREMPLRRPPEAYQMLSARRAWMVLTM